MPDYAKTVLLLMASFVMTSDTATTAHRVTRKNSKKNEAPPVCTWHNFAGSSKYRNCDMVETKIDIGCGDEDADDTTRMCKVTEHPWNDEKKGEDTVAAAAATTCVVHGSFDPKTHITTDSATGFCHLKFLPLFNSCDVDANGSPSVVFGMKAEIHNSRNTDNDDNSGMLLRFSHTGGAKYYNVDDPRETVPLHGVIPAHRKLQSTCGEICETSTGTYKASQDYCYWCYVGNTHGGNTHYIESTVEYCWNSQNRCPPKCSFGFWQHLDQKGGTCGKPCSQSLASGGEAFKGFVYNTVTSVYNPQIFSCFTDTDNPDKYCWYPAEILPYGNWVKTSDRAYNDCGDKCTKFDDGNAHNGIN